jgi:Holliday junction resolvase RusA-like endonuclease
MTKIVKHWPGSPNHTALDHLEFSVPLLPPSVNHYKQPGRRPGTWFLTPAASAYFDAVLMISKRQFVYGPCYSVDIEYRIREAHFLRSDLDNLQKVSLDALTRAEVIKDDRYITDLSLRKRVVLSLREEMTIYKIQGGEEL